MGYDKNQIARIYINDIAAKFAAAKLITVEQFHQIKNDFKYGLYTPSFFVRIGIFIFTSILLNAALGIIGVFFADLMNNETSAGILLLIAATGIYFVLEHVITKKMHYKSGMDDYLLLAGVSFLSFGLVLIEQSCSPLTICFILLPVLTMAVWRYADAFISLLAFICLYCIVFLIFKDYDFGRIFMPFIFLTISIACTMLFHKLLKYDSNFFYKNCLEFLKVASLLILYGSMNYCVVREGNMLLNEGIPGIENMEIPFGIVFLIATFLIPVIYIAIGVSRKDRLLLWTGLGVFVLSVLTLKYKYEYLEFKYLMTGFGALILVIAWQAIRYLKSNAAVYTFAPDDSKSISDLLNAEALIISQTLGKPQSGNTDESGFGGGSFGGGGAGGTI